MKNSRLHQNMRIPIYIYNAAVLFHILIPSSSWVPTSLTPLKHCYNPKTKCVNHICLHKIKTSTQSTSHLFSNSNNHDQNQEEMEMGLNELQTLLRKAVEVENYKEASRLKKLLTDRIQQAPTNSDDTQKRSRLSWIGLGTAPWLVDRLEALKFILPTTIQIHSLESINSMLSSSSTSLSPFETLEERYYLNDQSQPMNQPMDMSVVLSGSTGSGKTLAYLVPLLSTLSEALFTRQRIRVKAEEDLGDEMDDLLARVAVTTSPTLRGQGRNQVGGNLNKSDDDGKRVKTIAMGAALSSLGKGDKLDVRNPLALIVVPTRELGVQTAMLLYELVGGSTKKTALEFSGAANMFKVRDALFFLFFIWMEYVHLLE